LSTTPSTGMTGISLHMQWSLTSQSHGSIPRENNCFFIHCGATSTPSQQPHSTLRFVLRRRQLFNPWSKPFAADRSPMSRQLAAPLSHAHSKKLPFVIHKTQIEIDGNFKVDAHIGRHIEP
jgi:hypothetical protein